MPLPPSRSLEGFVSGLVSPESPEWPFLLFWLWGTDHGLAGAEVESLTGQPAQVLARGLVASYASAWQSLARLAFTKVVFACLGRSEDLTPPFEPAQLVTGTFAV